MTLATAIRTRVRVDGTVQGVGFRPFVYRLAVDLRLAGWVLNDERGVLLEVEGPADGVEAFVRRLRSEAPPLARVERLASEPRPPTGARGFRIVESDRSGQPAAPVTPDTATCDDCLAELFDPADRRYRYPFINCTNCGPRFTIVRGVPYDRPLTTMAAFEMCDACRAEYDDPLDRRFHAQPNACPECGPSLSLLDRSGGPLAADPLRAAAAALAAGRIVAVKGLGGYHLACAAANEEAVATLRGRKRREDKPFALMAADLEAARELVELTAGEEHLVRSRQRPIVIARRRPGARVARGVAPGSPDLGVMLPYSPLHHLLLRDADQTLVMTSGNVSDEPIAYEDADALDRLAGVADLFLVHDRAIHTRTDDSVVRSVGGRGAPLMLRRSRGYVPETIPLPVPATRPLLACGAQLKSTFCVAKGDRAWVSHHIGDLENWETLRSFREGIAHFERLFAVAPRKVVHDLHPDYLSTKEALERDGVEHLGVQHHHAHLAACLAEHGERGPAVGAIFDGTGYGPDGTVWGGELLVGDLTGFDRAGFLRPVRLPGGARAIKEPWRMACAWLAAADEDRPPPARLAGSVAPRRWREVAGLARTGAASPLTSSVGRLFDAVAALCGVRGRVSYEGQAAAELESVADRSERGAYPLPLDGDGPVTLDARPTVLAALRDAEAGGGAPLVSARFHNALAAATAGSCERVAAAAGVDAVVLAGGVFQNRLLLERTSDRLAAAGLRVLVPQRLPPNDGAISYGQAAVATALDALGG
ncbi:MAG TPA: carbamoyltransferase HypF [Thermoleophilaceae bacterium]|nr:carbamoyltransferase HypF [Thermoleophilaceae bacterium]